MKERIKKAIETYQCPGCVCGSDVWCYESTGDKNHLECKAHVAGIMLRPQIGRIFLGMPKGFCRLGPDNNLKIYIYNTRISGGYTKNKFNIPVWKYLDKYGNTLVRGYSPRVNRGWINIFLENCMDKIDCLEITKEDIEEMG